MKRQTYNQQIVYTEKYNNDEFFITYSDPDGLFLLAFLRLRSVILQLFEGWSRRQSCLAWIKLDCSASHTSSKSYSKMGIDF